MTETEPQAGVADAVENLSEQTRVLVRREIDAARREMWDKGKQAGPSVMLVGAAAMFGAFSVASAYRFAVRLLDKTLPPATAAFVATVAFGGTAGASAAIGVRLMRSGPVPLPTETAEATREAATRETNLPTGAAQG